MREVIFPGTAQPAIVRVSCNIVVNLVCIGCIGIRGTWVCSCYFVGGVGVINGGLFRVINFGIVRDIVILIPPVVTCSCLLWLVWRGPFSVVRG